MEYQIALSPDLGLSPEDFAAAWNEAAEYRNVAEARLSQSTSDHYDPFLLAGAIILLSNVGVNVLSNAVYDLIKQVLAKKGVKSTKIVEIDTSDGTHIRIIVTEQK